MTAIKASVVRDYGAGFHVEDVEIDTPQGREVLVEVKASGLCHTDELASNFDLGYPPPSVLGHEPAGVVTAVGPDVTEFEVGDHVVGSLVQFCGVVTGAGAVLNTADVQAGESVVVVGAGGVGLNAINGALTAGAGKIIAIDLADEKLERATNFGATHVVNSTKEDPVEAVKKITSGGADHVFDFVGLKQTVQQGVDMAALGGGVYLVGALDPTVVITDFS